MGLVLKPTLIVLLAVGLSTAVACKKSGGGGAPSLIAVGDQGEIAAHVSHDAILFGQVPMGSVLDAGEHLFAANFNTLDGAGRPETTGTGASRPRRDAPENFNRISAPDANSCAGCHNVPRAGGGGDNVANVFVLGQRLPFVNFDGGAGDDFQAHELDGVANERNTLGMFGSGYIELLAREMTVDLQAIRDDAVAQAQSGGSPVVLSLESKGVSFGSITGNPDGSTDESLVEGVDADLIVKPFHQKGVVISLREFTNNAMNHHHGMQTAERFGAGVDHDRDGLADELSVGDVTAVTLYQAALPPPGRVLPNDPAALVSVNNGEGLFTTIGCADCHTPYLVLDDPVFTEPSPFNPPGNLRLADVAAPIMLDLTAAGPGPRLPEEANGTVLVRAYTDLKRHDMGPGLAEPLVQAGVPGNEFLTKKLWGMSNEPPFLHHGRALTISEAILMHGGEGQAARDAFAALGGSDQADVVEFLKSLQVLPENATANEILGPASGIIGDEPAVAFGPIDQGDIDAGLYSAKILDALGRDLFDARFNTLDGAARPDSTGTGASRPTRATPQNFNRISGPEANSCAGCHNTPRSGGGGDNVANVFVLGQARPFVNFDGGAGDDFLDLDLDTVANERNTLGMFGAGYIELLAREMTVELQAIRDDAVAQAQGAGNPVTLPLESKGVSFGSITGNPDGSIDTGMVAGVDADLVVKPFHQKGVVISLREFSNNAMNHHHGMQSVERFGPGDPDGDGMSGELSEGDMTAVTLYQALLPPPGRVLPGHPARLASVQQGEATFTTIGCADCHVPYLVLDDPVFTEPNPFNPAGNLQVGDVAQPFAVDLTVHGVGPRLPRESNGTVRVPAFTDLKRHDMGPGMAEPLTQAGVPGEMFLTKKLWGMANEPPFMHHGRALTIREAILMHGGEGAAARQAFEALPLSQQHSVVDFLRTLRVMPAGGPLVAIE